MGEPYAGATSSAPPAIRRSQTRLSGHLGTTSLVLSWAAPRFPDCGFRVHLRGEL
jgi:hypothetical protein